MSLALQSALGPTLVRVNHGGHGVNGSAQWPVNFSLSWWQPPFEPRPVWATGQQPPESASALLLTVLLHRFSSSSRILPKEWQRYCIVETLIVNVGHRISFESFRAHIRCCQTPHSSFEDLSENHLQSLQLICRQRDGSDQMNNQAVHPRLLCPKILCERSHSSHCVPRRGLL